MGRRCGKRKLTSRDYARVAEMTQRRRMAIATVHKDQFSAAAR